MQNKLQELTDKLYNEGVSKGKKEAGEIVAQAQAEAAKIIADAKSEAERIVKEAEAKATETAERTNKDLQTASKQAITALRQQIESSMLNRTISKGTAAAMNDKEFICSIIKTIAGSFNPDSTKSVSLDVILPESMKSELDGYFRQNLANELNSGISISYEKMKSGGFRIGPSDGSYRISFTADDFESMIAEYLRPKSREIIFG